MSACFLVVMNGLALAESGDPDAAAIESQHVRASSPAPAPGPFPPTRVEPDPPPRRSTPPTVAPSPFPPSSDLDGFYIWLGPTGAASRIAAEWDSTIGADLSVIRVREHDLVGAIGATLGASRWTVRGGGRIWLDALVGTRIHRMVGLSAGPLLELGELSRPHWGGSVGLWAFVGVTPFVRVGTVESLGGFVEIGVHIALPVLRH